MKRRWMIALGVGTASLLGVQGCQSCRTACSLGGGCTACSPQENVPVAGPYSPTVGYLPPHPLTPAYAPAAPPAPAVNLGPVTPPRSSYASPLPDAPTENAWHAPGGSVRIDSPLPSSSEPPRALPQGPPQAPVRLSPPEAPPPEPRKPAIAEDRSRPPSLPVGIPQFAAVTDKVSAGLKPLVDGGLDWLQANSYRTVLHIHLPGQDDSADRQQVEKYGMKYQGLEVSPQTLTPAVVEKFNQTVTDPANAPLFVYDRDGALAGALWYLHFRTTDKVSDEVARTRAGRLGLKDDAKTSQPEIWLAIQKFLANMVGEK